jgi:hypothetical protein
MPKAWRRPHSLFLRDEDPQHRIRDWNWILHPFPVHRDTIYQPGISWITRDPGGNQLI